jgi:hypothetical protein
MAFVLLRVPVDDRPDEFIEVEVDRRDLGDAVEFNADTAAQAALASYTLASSFDRVMPALTTILTRLRTAEHAPDEIGMQLGLKVGGETGLVFARGSAEATFTVNLSWRKPSAS